MYSLVMHKRQVMVIKINNQTLKVVILILR